MNHHMSALFSAVQDDQGQGAVRAMGNSRPTGVTVKMNARAQYESVSAHEATVRLNRELRKQREIEREEETLP